MVRVLAIEAPSPEELARLLRLLTAPVPAAEAEPDDEPSSVRTILPLARGGPTPVRQLLVVGAGQ